MAVPLRKRLGRLFLELQYTEATRFFFGAKREAE